jgi:hypothetical protein
MSLRDVKKEVANLPNIKENLTSLQSNWIKPIRTNSNQNLPTLQNISAEDKQKLNQEITKAKKTLSNLEGYHIIHDKLSHYSRYLVELALTNIRDDHKRGAMITSQLLNDDFLSLKHTITQIKSYDQNIQLLSKQYQQVNDLLHKTISLEEAVAFMGLPHQRYLSNLLKTSNKQKKIVRDLGRHFVSLAKKKK